MTDNNNGWQQMTMDNNNNNDNGWQWWRTIDSHQHGGWQWQMSDVHRFILLNEIKNSVPKVISACFKPSLNYVVIKIPCWDLKTFCHVLQLLSMKSISKVMGISRTFEETIQKAIWAINNQFSGFAKVGSWFLLVLYVHLIVSSYRMTLSTKNLWIQQTDNFLQSLLHSIVLIPLTGFDRWADIDQWFLE